MPSQVQSYLIYCQLNTFGIRAQQEYQYDTVSRADTVYEVSQFKKLQSQFRAT